MVQNEISVLGEFSKSASGFEVSRGRKRKWAADQLLISATDLFYTITGYHPQRNLPVRSFEGFLQRFCRGIPIMENTDFKNLANAAIQNGGYKGVRLPISIEDECMLNRVFPKRKKPPLPF